MYRLAPVLNVLCVVVMIFSVSLLFPLGWSLGLADGIALVYLEAMAASLLVGAAGWFSTRKYKRELTPRDGFLLVALVWTVIPAFATLPLMLHLKTLSFTDAYFETVSGLTTTGATVLVGLDQLPGSLNLWRGLLVWLGGMGVVVLAVAILPLLGVGGSQIYKAETPGPMKDAKLTPRIAETAKGLWLVYLLITIACLLSLKAGGMPTWTDAFVHTFSIMGLGGFSSHDDSFGFFQSATLDWIAVVFMLIASFNFALHFLAFKKRSLRPHWQDPEARAFIVVITVSCLMLSGYLVLAGTYPDYWTALRYGTFNIVSIASTTGLVTTDYAQWPIFVPICMLFLSCFATCAGSTGGGIKMIRALLLLKQAKRELIRIIHPQAVVPVKLQGQVIENNVIFSVLAFMLMYGGTIIGMTLLLTATGLDVITSITAVVACINNMGPGLNQVGPATTFAVLTDFQTWICTAAMLLGRLELFTLIVIFTPAFWRK